MSTLIIVESPSKIKTVQKYAGESYRVMASAGHIRDLPKSLLGVDIQNHFKPRYVDIPGKSALIRQLRAAASYQTVVLLFSQILTFLADTVLLPLLLTAFALGMVATVSDAGHLGEIGDTLLKSVTWLIGILATVFTTLFYDFGFFQRKLIHRGHHDTITCSGDFVESTFKLIVFAFASSKFDHTWHKGSFVFDIKARHLT